MADVEDVLLVGISKRPSYAPRGEDAFGSKGKEQVAVVHYGVT